MSDRLALDASSFQELLAAAWVLQSQRDGEHPSQEASEPAAEPLNPSVIALSEPAAEVKATPTDIRSKKLTWRSLPLIPMKSKGIFSAAMTSAGPLIVLLVIAAFLGAFFLAQFWKHDSANILAKEKSPVQPALSSTPVLAITVPPDRPLPPETPPPRKSSDESAPTLESSHRRITDAPTLAAVESLSRYEIKSLRRRARYGDRDAALTLGMAYEVGRHLRRNCAQAAKWVRIAADAGHPAAQYNLALRYFHGDGVAASPDNTTRWLRAAASHGYAKARLALQREYLLRDPASSPSLRAGDAPVGQLARP